MKQEITILSLNIWHGNLKEKLLSYISSKIPDVSVFCFQETEPDIYKSIHELLVGEFNAYHADKFDKDHPMSNSTFVRKGVEVIGARTVLADREGIGSGLSCTIKQNQGGHITIANIHGQSRPGHKLDTPERIEQSEQIIKSIDPSSNTNILVGDFNLMPDTESVKMIERSGYRNLIKDFNIPTTRNHVAWNRFPDNKQLFADYTFIQSSDSVEYDFAVEDNDVSDHLPMILKLKFTD